MRIKLGLILIGLLCMVMFTTTAQSENNQPLEGQALDNVVAFTKLLGYVQYFHPSDAVAAIDWDDFALAHIESVESATTSEELAEKLLALFRPYAPTLQVYPTSTPPDAHHMALTQPESEDISVTMWVHSPHMDWQNNRNIFGPRVEIPLENGVIPATTPVELLSGQAAYTIDVIHPDDVFRAEIGGGVSITMPLALYRDAVGTLPYIDLGTLPDIEPQSPPDVSQRATRLAQVAIVWNTFQHFFSYWDQVNVNWHTALRDTLAEVATQTDEDNYLNTMRRFTALTQDAHVSIGKGSTRPSEDAAPPIGWQFIEGELVIVEAFFDTRDLVQPGDVVLSINGRPTTEVFNEYNARHAAGQLGLGQSYALAEILNGETGSTITLEIQPYDGGDTHTVELTRNFRRLITPEREREYPLVGEIEPGVVYVDMRSLTGSQLEQAVAVMAEADSVIVDMRGYPDWSAMQLLGYLSDEPVMTPPFFWPVVTRPDHENMQFVDVTYRFSQPYTPRLDNDNIAFITNWRAISRAEMFMGMVEGLQLAEIVGTPTAGINGEVQRRELPGGYNFVWTGMRVTKYDGSPLFNVGVTPTILAERTIAGVAAGRDEELDAAYEALTGRTAPASYEITPINLENITVESRNAIAEAINLVEYSNEGYGISSVVPEDWQEVEPGIFVLLTSPTDVTMLAFDTTDETVDSLGLPGEVEQREINGRNWQIIIERENGTVTQAAYTEVNGTVYIVAILTNEDNYAVINDAVFEEVLKAFDVVESDQ